ncbi:hypothetical protein [Granulicella sibirica]|uniref:Uncharacterized protein n=1 Tax=Granulicella sibirica TaxID=2479048 RepID=A0A4V1L550_9BACT|nr:hypothetical protein [Granulicella sibirica]RXH54534.1 hypothetical protein GRAN_3637 [Granulicella sibirica]
MERLRLVLIAVAGLGLTTALQSQQELPRLPSDATPVYPAPATTVAGVLQEMTSRAAIIFAGTVTSVRLPNPGEQAGNAAAGVVEVEFRVEQAVSGPAAGSTYIVREWAGLWRDGPRFEVGQRRLMLLRSPGPGGLSSPVDGLDGAIPVTGGDLVSPSARIAQGVQAHAAKAAKAVMPVQNTVSRVDLRWLQAKTLRSTNSISPALSRVATGFALGGVSTPEPATNLQPELGQVLGMLLIWQESLHAAH